MDLCNFCYDFEEEYYILKLTSSGRNANICIDCCSENKLRCFKCGKNKRIYDLTRIKNIIDTDLPICLRCNNASSSKSQDKM